MNEQGRAPGRAALADLLERCVLEYESHGEGAVERLLAGSEPELAAPARERLLALRAAGVLLAPGSAPPTPERIGPYRLLRQLGGGGMGRVFLAEQDAPIRRRVALKLIRPGLGTHDVLERFALERQALALLEHPSIAKIYDAGVGEDGQPWFAMEHVDGSPITRWCDERGLPADARVELFARVCDTVQHAHQRGILHRDLKPENILVTTRDGAPWPVLIDFGFAKALAPAPGLDAMHTQLGRVLGTPEYMSPEQAAYRHDLDTRSDVYSLGVVLYELLTGVLPIGSRRLREASPTELERILSDEVPPCPSAVVRRLRCDLDWIVMKALEKDRERRYAMAADLAADLRRCLAREPVLAGPASGWYRVRRLARKHRVLVGAGAVVALVLVASSVVSLLFAAASARAEARASSARILAEQSRDKAFEAADELLIRVGGEKLRAFSALAAERREMLEIGLRFCNTLLTGQLAGPVAELRAAQVHWRVALFLMELNRPAEALEKVDAGLALAARVAAASAVPAAAICVEIDLLGTRAEILRALGRENEEVATRAQALAEARELVRGDASDAARRRLDSARVWNAESLLLCERAQPEATADALACLRELAAREGAPEPHLARLLACLPVMAWALSEQGDVAESKRVIDEAERMLRRLRRASPDDDKLLDVLAPTLLRKAMVLRQLGDLRGASAELERVQPLFERRRKEAPGDCRIVAHLAALHQELGVVRIESVSCAEATKEIGTAVALQEEVVAARPESGAERARLGALLEEEAQCYEVWRRVDPTVDLAPGLAAAQRAAEVLKDLPPGPPGKPSWLWERGIVSLRLGKLLAATGQQEPARSAFADAVRWLTELVQRKPDVVRCRWMLADALHDAGVAASDARDLAAARALLERSVAQRDLVAGKVANPNDWAFAQCGACMALAAAQLASGDKDAFVATYERAAGIGNDDSTHRGELARGLGAAALAAPPELRPLAVERGRSCIRLALEKFAAEVASDHSAAMYVITRARLLGTEAELAELAGDPVAARTALAEALAIHERMFSGRGEPRDRARLASSFAAWIAHLRAHGTAAEVLGAEREQARLLGR